MVINFSKNLVEALENIQHKEEEYKKEYHNFFVHELEEKRKDSINCQIIKRYGDAKWTIVDILNARYKENLKAKFDLHNWINHNQEDEIAYFLNETGSNALNYSEFCAPKKFHLWLGKKGFVIGIEQKGEGFNALQINRLRLKDNEGAGFEFYRNCKNKIFFDKPEDAKIIFMEFKF